MDAPTAAAAQDADQDRQRWQRRYDSSRRRNADFTTLSGLEVDPVYGPPPGAVGPTLNLEYEAQFVRPTWPSVAGKQHITQHLDIAVTDLDAAVAWAAEAGATLADFQPQEHVRVMFDPAGHTFCLFAAGG